MNRLLRIEWNKTFYNKGTRIFLILYFVLIAILGLVIPNIKPNLNGIEVDFIKLGALNFPVIWHNVAWLVGFGKFFLIIIVINNISNEYSFGTFKQNVIDGLTKIDFFKSKLYLNLAIALASSLLVVGITLVLGTIFAKNFNPFNGIEFLLGYFIEILAFIIFAVFLSFLFKKSTFAILSIFVLYIFETIISGVETFSGSNLSFKLSSFLPLTSNSKIIDYPPASISGFITGGNFFGESHVAWEYLSINIFYIIVFTILSFFIIKKRDL